MIRVRNRTHWRILKVMEDFGGPMTIEMITQKSRQPLTKVLRFRDWAMQNGHVTSQTNVLGPGHALIWYIIASQSDDLD